MLEQYQIILASNSPRRKELLQGLDLPFQVHVIEGVSEDYPEDLPVNQIAEYISKEKAAAYHVSGSQLLITADTVVILGNTVLGKPANETEALKMLRLLSGKTHQVITGVTLTSSAKQHSFSVKTNVTFKHLTDEEIQYYVHHYKPFDKAGAYGIQEWIGYIGVTGLEGSYFNVMGLPVQRIYQELEKF